MKRYINANEPSLRDKLSAAYLEAFQADFQTHGVSVIEQLRNKSPDKYAEIAARLIAATEPRPDPESAANADSLPELGRRLLKSVGLAEDLITDEMVQEAVAANEKFVATLEAIRDSSQCEQQLN